MAPETAATKCVDANASGDEAGYSPMTTCGNANGMDHKAQASGRHASGMSICQARNDRGA